MDIVSEFLAFMYILIKIVVVLMIVGTALLLILKKLPNSRFKMLLDAFTQRVMATALVGLVGIPLQPIPEVDGLYDIGGLIFLAVYWYGMIHKIKNSKSLHEAKGHIASAKFRFPHILKYAKMLRKR